METVDNISEHIAENQLQLPKSILRTFCYLLLIIYIWKKGCSLGRNMASFAPSMTEDKFNNTQIFYQRTVDDVFAVVKSNDKLCLCAL